MPTRCKHTLTKALGHSKAIGALGRAGSTHLNSGSGREIPTELREKVASKNKLDQTLYDWAKAEFYHQLCAELGKCDAKPDDGAKWKCQARW